MKITYITAQSWKEAKSYLEEENNTKLVAWPSSICDNGFILAIGGNGDE